MPETSQTGKVMLDRGTGLDRGMLIAAYGYLTLPSLLFVLGWLRLDIGIPVAIVLVIACVCCVRAETPVTSDFLTATPARRQDLVAVILLVVAWFVLSGVGGYAFQNLDHHWRNIIFRDLVFARWPLVVTAPPGLPGSGQLLGFVYYLGHWLPAAAIGKLLGFSAALHALFIWSLLGGLLAFYFFFRHLRTLTFGLGVLFVAFSGLDIVGMMLMRLLSHTALPELGEHLESWAPYFQYSSITTTLYWVFNQAICVWVIVMLLLNQRRPGNLGYLLAMSFICAPYPAIGLVPIVLCLGYRLIAEVPRQPRPRWLTFRSVAPLLLLGGICGAYYLANNQQAGLGLGSGFFFHLFPCSFRTVGIYLLFCLLEYGVFVLLLTPAFRREPLFVVTGVALTLIPLYHSGVNNDFVMRASIPLLLVVMVYLARYFTREPAEQHRPTRIALLILLAIGAWTPSAEIIRSLVNTFQGTTIADRFHSYGDQHTEMLMLHTPAEFGTQFGSHVEQSFFFKYLARK